MLCPKCHQPLEGDEEYICCANAVLAWRCTDCAKVSEGFAFPYGSCPHCGGRLEALETRPIEDAAALKAVRTAFEIELGGMAFYQKASVLTGDAMVKQLFANLAYMEREHMTTLARRYHVEPPQPSQGLSIEVAALYAGVESVPEDPANLFRIAIAFEERAAAFFADQGMAADADSPAGRCYRELAAEEREHVAFLKTEYNRWKQGKPGLL
jgi:rubrerythrin